MRATTSMMRAPGLHTRQRPGLDDQPDQRRRPRPTDHLHGRRRTRLPEHGDHLEPVLGTPVQARLRSRSHPIIPSIDFDDLSTEGSTTLTRYAIAANKLKQYSYMRYGSLDPDPDLIAAGVRQPRGDRPALFHPRDQPQPADHEHRPRLPRSHCRPELPRRSPAGDPQAVSFLRHLHEPDAPGVSRATATSRRRLPRARVRQRRLARCATSYMVRAWTTKAPQPRERQSVPDRHHRGAKGIGAVRLDQVHHHLSLLRHECPEATEDKPGAPALPHSAISGRTIIDGTPRRTPIQRLHGAAWTWFDDLYLHAPTRRHPAQ